MIYRVADIDISELQRTSYDLAMFACGYENRCTFLPTILRRDNIREIVVLGFNEKNEDEQRLLNNKYFADHWSREQIPISSDDDGPIYDILNANREFDICRILVDYSSMSRLWYAAVLNWARFADLNHDLDIDLVYSVGEHREHTSAMVIQDITCIPGCEGGSISNFSSTAVFGLGFQGLAALCVLDRLEPDVVYAYLASPAAFDDYPDRAKKKNRELINAHAKRLAELPLTSVETTFRHLAELIAPHRSRGDITIIPMGPKPHVLAAILLAMRFAEVACLRVSGKGSAAEPVHATGQVTCTRVQFRKKVKNLLQLDNG